MTFYSTSMHAQARAKKNFKVQNLVKHPPLKELCSFLQRLYICFLQCLGGHVPRQGREQPWSGLSKCPQKRIILITAKLTSGSFTSTGKKLDTKHHYRTSKLCRVSITLGKGQVPLGKVFAECNTRQRIPRQCWLCRVSDYGHSAKQLRGATQGRIQEGG